MPKDKKGSSFSEKEKEMQSEIKSSIDKLVVTQNKMTELRDRLVLDYKDVQLKFEKLIGLYRKNNVLAKFKKEPEYKSYMDICYILENLTNGH